MNAMKNKIKSQKGASITFALLLFLVCAIISSIVIVAATAVGGRASQMAQLDQRYYSVNSAAELLRDVLEQQTVVVTAGTKTVTTVDQDENPVQKKDSDNKPMQDTDGKPIYDQSEEALDKVVTVNDEETTDTESLITAAALLFSGTEEKTLGSLSLKATLSGAAKEADSLSVTITPTPDKTNRKLYITVSNTIHDKGTYTLGLTFKADIVKNENERTSYSAPKPTTEDGRIVEGEYTRVKTVYKTKVSTIRWKLIDMQTVVATAPSSTASTGG